MSISTIIGLIMLSAFIVPAFIVIQKQRRNKKQLEDFLHQIELEHDMKVTEHEAWRNKIIGLDQTGQKALFVVHDKMHSDIQIIDLKHIAACSVEKQIVTSEFDKTVQAVSSIRIRFRSREKSKPDQLFVLFDEEADMTLGHELNMAEIWTERFVNLLKKLAHAA